MIIIIIRPDPIYIQAFDSKDKNKDNLKTK
jgi:hypothetical protein